LGAQHRWLNPTELAVVTSASYFKDKLDAARENRPPAGNLEVEGSWCGRPELNRHGLTPNGFSYHYDFRRRRSAFVVWTIPSP